jgi:hypothetical protein
MVEAGYTGTRCANLDATRQYDSIPRQYLSALPTRDTAAINFLGAQVNNPFSALLPGTSLSARTVSRSQLLRPYPQFTGITAVQSAGTSSYHAAQLRAQRRLRQGFTLQGSYTFSKYLIAQSYLNDTDAQPEQLVSGDDRPHRLTASGIWELLCMANS